VQGRARPGRRAQVEERTGVPARNRAETGSRPDAGARHDTARVRPRRHGQSRQAGAEQEMGGAMSQNNGKAKGKKSNKKPKLELHVAPRVGTRASREVVAGLGDLQFTDVFDTSKASAREKFAARLRKKWDVGASDLDGIDELLVQAAEQADEEAEEAAKKGAA